MARTTPILKNVDDERIPAWLEEVHIDVNPTFEHLLNVYVNLGPNSEHYWPGFAKTNLKCPQGDAYNLSQEGYISPTERHPSSI